MNTQHHQRTSLIGSVEEKTEECRAAKPKNSVFTRLAMLRPLVAIALLTLCSFLASGRSGSTAMTAMSADAMTTHTEVQRADIIDEIIEIIEKIINPGGDDDDEVGPDNP